MKILYNEGVDGGSRDQHSIPRIRSFALSCSHILQLLLMLWQNPYSSDSAPRPDATRGFTLMTLLSTDPTPGG
jgi:hypothetical protein